MSPLSKLSLLNVQEASNSWTSAELTEAEQRTSAWSKQQRFKLWAEFSGVERHKSPFKSWGQRSLHTQVKFLLSPVILSVLLPEQLLKLTLIHDEDEMAALPTLTSFSAPALLVRGRAEVSLPHSEEFRWWRRKLPDVQEPTCCICCLQTSTFHQQQRRLPSHLLNFISKSFALTWHQTLQI